jgi:hypothetical protein
MRVGTEMTEESKVVLDRFKDRFMVERLQELN